MTCGLLYLKQKIVKMESSSDDIQNNIENSWKLDGNKLCTTRSTYTFRT